MVKLGQALYIARLKGEPTGRAASVASALVRNPTIFIGRETPCGPRLIGVRLGDLLKWLTDPQSATKRDFLGMISGGCPEKEGR